mmetsp:Transcript_12499/g.17460  ORF Transcript_12499/g.17460 Transcript_12499/m.17460 type:complete len:237 (-) Transcript_12499:108-818(-)
MGNAAAKEIKETELADGSLSKDDSLSVVPSFVTKEALTAKAKGKSWINAESKDAIFTSKSVGIVKSHSLIQDPAAEDAVVAVVITEKMTMTTVLNFICRTSPTFEGQDPLSKDELERAGFKDEDKQTKYYKYSKIDTARQMTTAKSTYSIVTGKEEDNSDFTFQVLYTGEKLPSMGFRALFKEGDTCVAKAATSGMSFSPFLEAAVGVDLLAIILMGYTLAGGDGNAGALAGAGVI